MHLTEGCQIRLYSVLRPIDFVVVMYILSLYIQERSKVIGEERLIVEATLRKWGNSQGVLIPKSICEYLGISVGDSLQIREDEGSIVMQPVRKRFVRSRKLTASELFADWNGEYQPPSDWSVRGAEVDWGAPLGGEALW